MSRLVFRIIANSFALFAATLLLPGVSLTGVWTAMLAGTTLTLLNVIIRPFLLLIMLPVTLITLGLFTLVINTWMVMLTARLIAGVTVPGFWSAFFVSLLVTFVNLLSDRSRLVRAVSPC